VSTIQRGNWSMRDPGDDIPDGSIINGGNFSQHTPETVIMADKPLIINGGNFVNVAKDPAWTVNGGNWTQISRCSHLHPGWVAKGLSECAEDCDHVVSSETVLGETIYEYKDTVQ